MKSTTILKRHSNPNSINKLFQPGLNCEKHKETTKKGGDLNTDWEFDIMKAVINIFRCDYSIVAIF